MNKFLVTTAGLVLGVMATVATAQDGERSRDRDTGEARVEERDKQGYTDGSHGAPRDGSHDGRYNNSGRDRGGYSADAGRDGNHHDGNRYDGNRYDGNHHDANRHADRRYDGRHDGNHYDGHRRDGIWDGYRGDHHTGRGYDHRGGHRYGDRGYRHYGRYRAPHRYAQPRGYYARSWSIGHRLPPAYYGPTYYVDYRPYGLSPPPYGYRWVRIANDVVLVAIATGLIADIVDDLYY